MSLYTISAGTLPLASDVQQLVDVFNGKHDIGAITFAPVIAVPVLGAASASASAGAGLSVGIYKYVFTYKTGYRKTNGVMQYAGETMATAFLTATTTSPNSRITLASLPTAWPASAVGLAIYRTTVGGATYKLVTILTAPTSSYIDSTADGSLTTAVPVTNTTGVTIPYVDNVNAALLAHETDYTLQVPYGGSTTGSANTYVLAAPAISALTVGMAVSVKFNVDSTAASTLNWNGKGAKGIKKANGTDVTNLKATGIYTLRYDGTNFILQGEGGGGNAVAAHLLAGETATVDSGDIVGTMPDLRGVNSTALSAAADGGGWLLLQPPNGSVDSASRITSYDADFIAANIPLGMNVFGLAGTGANAKRKAMGSGTSSGAGVFSVSGLSFTPNQIYINIGDLKLITFLTGSTNLNKFLYDSSTISHLLTTNWVVSAGAFSCADTANANTAFTWSACE